MSATESLSLWRLRGRRGAAAGVLAGLLFVGAARHLSGQAANASLDSAFSSFWKAENPGAAEQAARKVLDVTQDYAAVLARLKTGRPYEAGARTGVVAKTRRSSVGLLHPYFFVVPEKYDPSKAYAVRFYLHGGVGRPAWYPDSLSWQPNYASFAREDSIVVFPAAWNESRWWRVSQVENLSAILDDLKRTYNIDENQAYLLGVSDGASGLYYHAMLATTPWAAFLPFNGQPAVLANPDSEVDEPLYVPNLALKPFYVVHGGHDPLYPLDTVTPWWDLIRKVGTNFKTHVQEQAGHDTRWYPQEAPLIDAFIRDNHRDPLPDKLSWEAGQAEQFNRVDWVVIDELGAAANEAALPSLNETVRPPIALGVGILGWSNVDGQGIGIMALKKGSIAEAAGLVGGDVVDEFDGVKVATIEKLGPAIEARAGAEIQLGLVREGKRVVVKMTLPTTPIYTPRQAYPRATPSGRIEVERRGNLVDVRTRGITKYILLLSPDRFDFSKPIKVVTNGAASFEGLVKPTAATLLKWAARDNDRTMLFGYELDVNLPAAAAAHANH